MTDAALLAVVDAVAWLRAAAAGSSPAVDLCASWSRLGVEDLEDVARDSRVADSHVLQQLLGLEHMRRQGKIQGWKFVAAERGAIRVDLLALGRPSKMIVLRA